MGLQTPVCLRRDVSYAIRLNWHSALLSPKNSVEKREIKHMYVLINNNINTRECYRQKHQKRTGESKMSSSSSEENYNSPDEDDEPERNEIREDLKSMSFEEIMKLKEELGSKLYKEAVLGVDVNSKKSKGKGEKKDFKRLNKNRPREQTSTRQVPFLGAEMRMKRKKDNDIRDPRFDERAGEYDVKKFKENYKFVGEIREKEVDELKSALGKATDDDERQDIKKTMQRLINKNVEENKWHKKQQLLKDEQAEIQKAIAEGKQPHFITKKERRAKELVAQFEDLKQTGKLTKHLEKRRKKNAAKDRKRIGFD